ncbi:MAG: ABC transporter ATP-binding protein [Elusimicrobia bacterium]|nr:ABC transporter ATP-binding protein [Elusimicrobiota bacterium]MDE2236872.1 ABC transporter ATP-binding protein [Elusimicrobiota bacterium]MDE2426538.1 ABC transporter ATP-binding protein [Elusimicrobiota bacterium]
MAETVLEARGISKRYGMAAASLQVFRKLDFVVQAASFCVVLGPSGSGKSTLLNLLGLMDRPDEGEIVFSGRATKTLGEEARSLLRNQRLGFIFQFDSLLPEFTVLENITMPARIAAAQGRPGASMRESERRGLELLERLGLARLPQRLPSQCSGGERQRIALCRALLNRPTVLLADEPTGNLDKQNGEMIFSDLKALAHGQGAAVVMVTHNETACGYADRVLRMREGALMEDAK